MKKIAELTEQHKKLKASKQGKPLVRRDSEELSSGGEADEIDADGDVKMKSKNNKKQFASKNTVSKAKLANKRNQKEAIKKNKMKRNKGTQKAGNPEQN